MHEDPELEKGHHREQQKHEIGNRRTEKGPQLPAGHDDEGKLGDQAGGQAGIDHPGSINSTPEGMK